MYDIAASPVHPPGYPSTHHHLPVQSRFARRQHYRSHYQYRPVPPVYYSCIHHSKETSSIEELASRPETSKPKAGRLLLFPSRQRTEYDWQERQAS